MGMEDKVDITLSKWDVLFLVHCMTLCRNQLRTTVERYRKRAVELLADERDALADRTEMKMHDAQKREKHLLRISSILMDAVR